MNRYSCRIPVPAVPYTGVPAGGQCGHMHTTATLTAVHHSTLCRGQTKEEFINFVRRAQQAFWDLMSVPSNMVKWVETLGLPHKMGAQRSRFEQVAGTPAARSFFFPIWSWDRPRIHGGRGGASTEDVLRRAGVPRDEFFDLPTRSGMDIGRTIEHVHGRLQQAFENWYSKDPQPYTVQGYKGVLQFLFFTQPSVAGAGVIEADLRALPATLMRCAVLNGGEVEKPYR